MRWKRRWVLSWDLKEAAGKGVVGKAAVITLRVKTEIALVYIETHIERKAVFAVCGGFQVQFVV